MIIPITPNIGMINMRKIHIKLIAISVELIAI